PSARQPWKSSCLRHVRALPLRPGSPCWEPAPQSAVPSRRRHESAEVEPHRRPSGPSQPGPLRPLPSPCRPRGYEPCWSPSTSPQIYIVYLLSILGLRELAPMLAVAEVDQQSNGEPDEEANPGDNGEPGH